MSAAAPGSHYHHPAAPVLPSPAAPAAAGSAATVDHLLALKVMRLTRPTLAAPLVVTADPKLDLLRDSLDSELRADAASLRGLEELALGQTLVLPQSFGNIYLGETFTSYVSLHNDSTETCQRVTLRCDLQTASQRIPLFPVAAAADGQASVAASSQPTTAAPTDNFLPGSSIDHVLNHEVTNTIIRLALPSINMIFSVSGQGAGRPHPCLRGDLLRAPAGEAQLPKVLQVPGHEAPRRQDQVLQR